MRAAGVCQGESAIATDIIDKGDSLVKQASNQPFYYADTTHELLVAERFHQTTGKMNSGSSPPIKKQ